MKRVISVWLPRWPIDRLHRERVHRHADGVHAAMVEAAIPSPFALITPNRRGPVLQAVDRAAGAAGLRCGMRLADARALCADLAVEPADLAADRKELERLALWCNRFAPCCAVDGDDGLLLDITGCARLFGGEAVLMGEITERFAGLGVEARTGLADTPGAARALARFGPEERMADPGRTGEAIADLPVEALGIAVEDAHLLRRLGIVTIGALDRLPRSALARRFPCRERGGGVLLRLDRALGRSAEPLVPVARPPVCMERLALPEPMTDRDGVDAVLARLMPGLIAALKRQGLGVRHLVFWCCRIDGGTVRRAVSTARATRDGDHLVRLFRETTGTVDPGFGIDCAALHAVRVEPLEPVQLPLTGDGHRCGDVNLLIDRLRARLGADAVCRLEPVDRHRPEKAERTAMPDRDKAPRPWPDASDGPQRPFRLFDRPEPVDVVAETPESPPRLFTWRGACRSVARAAGPERIEPEWWIDTVRGTVRDYYSIEDSEGRRYWLYRADRCSAGHREPSRWYVHGLYG